ncbi:branched-chain amino acid ABC transporter permease [Corticibacter populi]|uniref:Branched-chain amino acid ABC transporter permease n=1 Tax=Corticibacter populi TaxID=1550736 RepID=A0A3M6QZB6_9BURK|nr:branched-chain amino acid ABC transporter permease [Corticibacter populi]RMX07882.1 branched-chain amino acid ABC transporter permease [Corticibacter populi]RZS35122.1 amino acid/amide ABC transporter membrane protein 2 (HAAT family) [Corticibacter populi]
MNHTTTTTTTNNATTAPASKPGSPGKPASAVSHPLQAAARVPRLGKWRVLIWGLFALALIVLPKLFTSGLALTMLSQMGYLIIICLSYNILLGQGGMLSFGHAVYVGLGAFIAIHVLNRVGAGAFFVPVSLIPLVGGFAGAFFAALFGYVTTKKAGTTFAMITLGIGELVAAMSLMFPEFFGGEGGISTDRVVGEPFLGISFGPSIQMYYLIAAYCFVCTVLMFAFTRTPLGRMLNAVRDNPERVEFIGYNTQRVRYFSFIISGFFAGIGGGLMVMHFEIITAMDSLSALRSGAYLLFTFLGGATLFFGPIIGAVLMVFATILLSELTQAWMLYLGLVFLFMVMFAPGGVAGIIMLNVRVMQFRRFGPLLLPYVALFVALTLAFVGVAALIEMVYHLQMNAVMSTRFQFMGQTLDVASRTHWVAVAGWAVLASALFEWVRRGFVRRWHRQQELIEADIRQRHERGTA